VKTDDPWPLTDPSRRGETGTREGTDGRTLFSRGGSSICIDDLLLSSNGICRGESGAPSSVMLEKYGWRPESRASCGFSRDRIKSSCRAISLCMLVTRNSVSVTRLD
jgi:hypothetical protein